MEAQSTRLGISVTSRGNFLDRRLSARYNASMLTSILDLGRVARNEDGILGLILWYKNDYWVGRELIGRTLGGNWQSKNPQVICRIKQYLDELDRKEGKVVEDFEY